MIKSWRRYSGQKLEEVQWSKVLSSSDVPSKDLCSINDPKAGLELKRRTLTALSFALVWTVSQHMDMNKNTKPLQL